MLEDGIHRVPVHVIDPLYQVDHEDALVRIDRTGPKVTLSGPLKDANGQVISEDSYRLDVLATDEDPSGPRAGVKEVTVKVNGTAKNPEPWTADCDSCSIEQSFMFDLKDYDEGSYTIEVTATDRAGNSTTSDPIAVVVEHPRPRIDQVTHEPELPTGWVDTMSLSSTVTASARRFGVERIELTTPEQGGDRRESQSFGCDGAPLSPCPQRGSKRFTYSTGAFRQGVVSVRTQAFRPIDGKASDVRTWPLKVDHDSPLLREPTGRLKDVENQWFSGEAALHVEATDGAAQGERSGVKSIELRVDGERHDIKGLCR